MKINVRDQVVNPAVPLKAVNVFAGSALPIVVVGIGEYLNGKTVRGVTVKLTNANGVEVTGACAVGACGWSVLFAAYNFANYGFVSKGVKVFASVSDGSSTSDVLLGVGDFEILAASASSQPGTFYALKGDRCFVRSRVVGGVQHYVEQTMEYDAQIGWGANWSGDYILSSSGEFIEFTEA